MAGLLDVQLEEVPDWNCCGATADPDDCARCLNCLRACPYGVPKFDHELGRVTIDPASCHGCGNCCATCPALAIEVKHSKNPQFESMLKAI